MRITRYFDHIASLVEQVKATDLPAIEQAASLVADTIMGGGIVQAFGSGHSRAAAMEISQRAGGLVPVKLLDEPSQGRYEKIPGVGTMYMTQCDIRPKDLLIVISNSGGNSMPLEIAAFAKKVGCKIIAVTALDVSKAEKEAKPDKPRLYELADVVLDLHSCHGDAAFEVAGVPSKVCGTSSVMSAMLLDSVMLEAIEIMVERGFEPPVLLSGNIEGGEDYGRKLMMKYMDRLMRNHTYYL